ncbi:uncharacterized protein J3D65DRAFT_311636 [Phyllosticta citribraziliensis]|uniref:Secreted protein n=1 Tax=Phyllosticta citribraziliensis TaxID=989973 RepID=A0ABR1LS78_9PEZI
MDRPKYAHPAKFAVVWFVLVWISLCSRRNTHPPTRYLLAGCYPPCHTTVMATRSGGSFAWPDRQVNRHAAEVRPTYKNERNMTTCSIGWRAS